MSRIEFFMTPEEFFDKITPVLDSHKASIIFRRFKSDKYDSGFRIMKPNEDLAEIYNSEAYAKAYISIGALPSSSEDWGYTDNAEDELLELTGGHADGKDLELSSLRIFAKKSKANKLFNDIKVAIAAICSKGEIKVNDTAYPNIYYSDASKQLSLYLSFSDKSQQCSI